MSYSKIIKTLLSFECDYVLGTHISPDSDAIGSSVALYITLENAGKQVKLFLEKSLSERFVGLVPKHVKIINEVPSKNAAVVTMFYLEEFNTEEISEVLQISVANVKVMLHRSRNLLREIIEKRNLVQEIL